MPSWTLVDKYLKPPFPKGPKIERILKIALWDWEMFIKRECEHFKQAAHQTPIIGGEFWRSRLKFSSEIEKFKRDWISSIFGPLAFGKPPETFPMQKQPNMYPNVAGHREEL